MEAPQVAAIVKGAVVINVWKRIIIGCLVLSLTTLTAWAEAATSTDGSGSWLAMGEKMEADAAVGEPVKSEPEPEKEGPPLPFHCIEGYSGGAITPLAYICNACPKGQILGKPSVAYTFVLLGSRKLHVVSVVQPFLERFEFGYAYNRLDVGSLHDDITKAGLNLGRDHVQLHHFNLRCQILPENSFDLPLPAVTAGVHFKYNDGIARMDRSLGGALKTIGYHRNEGTDFTLTATKMFPKLAFGRPVILTAGLRNSRASQLGLLGFGDSCATTVEGSVVYLPLDNVALAYEFRQKNSPYHQLPKLIGREQAWHAFSTSWIINNNLTLTGALGVFGNIANARDDCAFIVQVKYEF